MLLRCHPSLAHQASLPRLGMTEAVIEAGLANGQLSQDSLSRLNIREPV